MRVGLARAIGAAVAVLSILSEPVLLPLAGAQAMEALRGSAGRMLTPRGEWEPRKRYEEDDIVTTRGSAWRALRANSGREPGQTSPVDSPVLGTVCRRAQSDGALDQHDDLSARRCGHRGGLDMARQAH
jgi:hypothetical protein